MSDKWLLLADIYFAVVVGNVCVGGGTVHIPYRTLVCSFSPIWQSARVIRVVFGKEAAAETLFRRRSAGWIRTSLTLKRHTAHAQVYLHNIYFYLWCDVVVCMQFPSHFSRNNVPKQIKFIILTVLSNHDQQHHHLSKTLVGIIYVVIGELNRR